MLLLLVCNKCNNIVSAYGNYTYGHPCGQLPLYLRYRYTIPRAALAIPVVRDHQHTRDTVCLMLLLFVYHSNVGGRGLHQRNRRVHSEPCLRSSLDDSPFRLRDQPHSRLVNIV